MINKHNIEQHLLSGGTFEDWHGDPSQSMETGYAGIYVQFDGSRLWVHYSGLEDADPAEAPEWDDGIFPDMETFLKRLEGGVQHEDYYYRLI